MKKNPSRDTHKINLGVVKEIDRNWLIDDKGIARTCTMNNEKRPRDNTPSNCTKLNKTNSIRIASANLKISHKKKSDASKQKNSLNLSKEKDLHFILQTFLSDPNFELKEAGAKTPKFFKVVQPKETQKINSATGHYYIPTHINLKEPIRESIGVASPSAN